MLIDWFHHFSQVTIQMWKSSRPHSEWTLKFTFLPTNLKSWTLLVYFFFFVWTKTQRTRIKNQHQTHSWLVFSSLLHRYEWLVLLSVCFSAFCPTTNWILRIPSIFCMNNLNYCYYARMNDALSGQWTHFQSASHFTPHAFGEFHAWWIYICINYEHIALWIYNKWEKMRFDFYQCNSFFV